MNWKVQIAFGSAILTLLVIGAISLESRSQAKESQRWVEHTQEVLANLERMEEDIALVQSDRRAFLAGGEPSQKEAFDADLMRTRSQLIAIKTLTSDNPVQQRRLKDLDALLLREGQGVSVAIGDRPIEEAIAEITDQLQNEELRLLKLRADENGRRLERNGSTTWIRILVGLSITIVAAWAVQREGTKRSRAELALRQGEERIRGLLQSAPDPWIVLSPECKIVLLNAQTEAQFGYSQQELMGLDIASLLPDGLPEKFLPLEKRHAPHDDGIDDGIEPRDNPTPSSHTIEAQGMRKDGSSFIAEMTISSFQTADGTLTSAALRDISERRRVEQHLEQVRRELQRSNEELQRFAYVTSHDLQEPLRMVASYVQLLSKRYGKQLDSDADEFIGYAVDGCIRMKQLIQDLLAYSRAGAEQESLRTYSVEAIVDHALGNLRATIRENGAEITRDRLPTLVADEMQLVQIFQNLIGNAIKYRREERPRIHISARRSEQDEWIFSVRDNGAGIEAQYFEKIFVIFQRLQADKGTGGTGIGLAICKRLIERLGGRIWLESEPGVGSTFYFSLPLQAANGSSPVRRTDEELSFLPREPQMLAPPAAELVKPSPQA